MEARADCTARCSCRPIPGLVVAHNAGSTAKMTMYRSIEAGACGLLSRELMPAMAATVHLLAAHAKGAVGSSDARQAAPRKISVTCAHGYAGRRETSGQRTSR